MSSTKVAVVIPTYKEELDEFEKISLAQVRKILGKYPLVFIAPEGKNFSYFKPEDIIVHCPSQYFQSLESYNQLMMSPQFYETFLIFDYILIYQLDAFVFYDALEFFCSLGYDYIGAPIPYSSWYGYKAKKVPRVGNGGFSLRKVKACYQLVKACSVLPNWDYLLKKFYEDAFFGFCGVRDDVDFKTAPVFVAVRFAFDFYPERFIKRTGKIPFGCHGWPKFGADFYVKAFAKYGWDLRPLRDKMGNEDYQLRLTLVLEIVAIKRLIRGIKSGQSVLQYLPTKNFSSVRVIRSSGAMKILAGLIQENSSVTDKIFFYGAKDYLNLVQDVTREDLPHLIISEEYDESLTKQIKEKGLRYGEHVISFWQEYMEYEEKLFHNLGK